MFDSEYVAYKLKRAENFFANISWAFYELLKFFMLFVVFIVALVYLLWESKLSESSVMIVKLVMQGFRILFYFFLLTGSIGVVFLCLRKVVRGRIRRLEIIREQVENKLMEKKNGNRTRRAARKSR